MEKKFEIDIKRLLFELLYKAWAIVLAAAVLACGGWIYSKTQLTPRYTASASLYVSNHEEQKEQNIQKVNSSDIYTSQTLVQTYLTFLSTDKVLDQVSKNFDYEFTSSELRGMISANAMNETEIFNVSITCEDPEKAAAIVNAIADLAPNTIQEYIEGSSVKIVDYAKVPKMRSFPVYRKYIRNGAVMGGGLAAVVIVMMFLFNSKISNEDDITKLFNAPVIGKIPNFRQRQYSSSYNYKYGYRYGYEYKSHKKDEE